MRRLLVIAALLLVPVAVVAAWWGFTAEHVYREITAPDGSWQVTVLRQRVPPYIEGVDVIVRARDASGALLFEARIDNRDYWSEVEELYPILEIKDDTFRAGSDSWGGGGPKFFILKKTELEVRPNQALQRTGSGAGFRLLSQFQARRPFGRPLNTSSLGTMTDSLPGIWRFKEARYKDGTVDEKTINPGDYTLNADGSGSFDIPGLSLPMNWRIIDRKLRLQGAKGGGGRSTSSFETPDENTLILTDQYGRSSVYSRVGA